MLLWLVSVFAVAVVVVSVFAVAVLFLCVGLAIAKPSVISLLEQGKEPWGVERAGRYPGEKDERTQTAVHKYVGTAQTRIKKGANTSFCLFLMFRVF